MDAGAFKAAMSRLPTGVAVVTAPAGDSHEVLTVGTAVSVSLQPALVLVSVGHEVRWLAAVRASGHFAVNVLAHGHEQLARWCADRRRHDEPERLEAWSVTTSTRGLLTLPDALTAVECTLHSEVRAGDHVLVLGQVEGAQLPRDPDAPLPYFNRNFRKPQLGMRSAVAIRGRGTVVSRLHTLRIRVTR